VGVSYCVLPAASISFRPLAFIDDIFFSLFEHFEVKGEANGLENEKSLL
jgi:hypothetical protein